ncbi:MAG: hypothetical protein M3Z31_10675 [Pseudomonadota bacterium]|nr:hypothetical protein [Pseudomonadota bacterium]
MKARHVATSVVETEADAVERDAFNAAFREIGLRWHWDAGTFRELKHLAADESRIHAYVESRCPHLLKAYDVAFLADAVRAVKAEKLDAFAYGRSRRYADCADFATAQMGF